MTPDSPIIAELRTLLDALCDETITPDQLRRLEELVLTHPEAEAFYVRFMSFYADLIGHVAGLPEPVAARPDEPAARPALSLPPRGGRTVAERNPSPDQPEKRKRLAESPWGIVAIAVLVLVVFGVPAGYQLYGWYTKSREAEQAKVILSTERTHLAELQAAQEAVRQESRKELERTTAAEQQLTQGFQSSLEAARKAIVEKDFVVRLTGPDHAQPGAPNRWQIETLRHGAVGRPQKLDVVVKDAKDTELFRQTHDKPVGVASLELPASFWAQVKPGSDLFLEVVAHGDGRKSVLAERIPLSRPVYVTHLATDKPLYKPGETIRFRSLTLDRASLRPPTHDLHLKFRLRDPADAVIPLDEGNGRVLTGLQPVLGPDKNPLRGIGVGEHQLSADAAGGEYKLDLLEVQSGTRKEVLLETRKFIVNRYVADTFEKKLEFDGKSYGAGEVVQARVEVSRTAGGPMKNATANIVATVDGREFHTQNAQKFTVVTEGGATKAVLNVRFKLPADIFEKAMPGSPPNATLSVNVQDGSDSEPIVRPIPLVTKNLNIEFFPEGGDLVAGIEGRVYFQVRNTIGKPADMKGVITDGTEKIADIATLTDAENPGVNRGHGVFTLTPKVGTRYFLKITSPSGITEPTKDGFPLPVAKAEGVALAAIDTVTSKGKAIRVKLQAAQAKSLHVGAYARGRLIAHQKVDVEANKPVEVSLQGDEAAGGVTRVTVFEEPKGEAPGRVQLIPRAERLVYRAPGEQLMLNVNPDKSRYTPSGKVRLELSAFNEKEAPTPAVLLVGVVNRSIITMADNKTDRHMPTRFLLSGEVKHPEELEHADFLLTDHPKAAAALDLLLGTQGWRRFAEQTGSPLNPADKGEVDRMLVAHGQRSSAPLELFQLEEQRIASEFRPKLEQATLARATAENAWNGLRGEKGQENAARLAVMQEMVAEAEKRNAEAQAALFRFETRPGQPRSWALPLLVLGFFGLGVGGIVLAVNRPGHRGSFVLGSLAAFALCTVTIGGIVETRGTREAEVAWNQLNPDRRNAELLAAKATRDAAEAREMAAAIPEMDRMNRARPGAAGAVPPPLAMPGNFPADNRVPAAPNAGFPGLPGPKSDPVAVPDGKLGAKKPAEPMQGLGLRPVPGMRPQPGRGIAPQREKEQLADALKKPAVPGMPGRPAMGEGKPAPFAEDVPVADEMFKARAQAVLPFVVREFAHQRDPSLGDVRADFTETVYWHPVLVLPESGKATVEFQLSDDIARYEVLVAGHTTDGRIGVVTKTLEARKPFSIDPKLPLEISHTDIVDVPIRVTNDSEEKRVVDFVGTTLDGLKPEGGVPEAIELPGNGKGRKVLRVKADRLQGPALVALSATSGREKDSILRSITVVPDGFPGVGSFSDTIEGKTRGTVTLPKGVVPGSLRVRLEMYPTSMADLMKGLEGMLQEPGGCFEQTSSSNYPNTMIIDYMNQTNQTNPELARRAKGMLERGYGRLTSYECPDTPEKRRQGFEWFGATDMQHEALTAFGLLQFKDMARVTQVDPELIKRTQQFLLSRRDGQGGFRQNPKSYHSWSAAKQVVNAYIVWALVESDPDDAEKMDLRKEIDALKAEALKEDSANGKDSYFVALVANVLLHRGDREAAHRLLDRLQEKHTKGGKVTGAVTSVTCSGGQALEIETTAFALLGWLRANDPKYATTVKEATKWLTQQRGGYGAYGSTQSTVLALKALTLHAKKSAHPAEAGDIQVLVGGKVVGTRAFTKDDVEVIGLDISTPEQVFKAGGQTEVEIVTSAKQAYPFALSYAYTTLTPVSAEQCAVRISTKLARTEATEGDTVPLAVTFENKHKQGHGMAVAIVGIPAGMKVPTDMKQLTDLREKGQIAFFETRGRELVLYWRELAPEQKISLSIDLVCDVPGVYRGPASRGYLYYNADHKHWVEPLSMTIAPMKE